MDDIHLIDKFCNTGDFLYLDETSQTAKDIFYKISGKVIRNNIGNVELARKVRLHLEHRVGFTDAITKNIFSIISRKLRPEDLKGMTISKIYKPTRSDMIYSIQNYGTTEQIQLKEGVVKRISPRTKDRASVIVVNYLIDREKDVVSTSNRDFLQLWIEENWNFFKNILRRGDLIINEGFWNQYRNEPRLFWDGKKLLYFDYENNIDEYGLIPKELTTFSEFPHLYFSGLNAHNDFEVGNFQNVIFDVKNLQIVDLITHKSLFYKTFLNNAGIKEEFVFYLGLTKYEFANAGDKNTIINKLFFTEELGLRKKYLYYATSDNDIILDRELIPEKYKEFFEKNKVIFLFWYGISLP